MKIQPAYDSEEKCFPLVLDPLFVDGKKWIIEKPFAFNILEDGVLAPITVPAGFITDFASIPRLFWTLIGSPTGKYGKPAVIHDYLYYSAMYQKAIADEIFLVGMKVVDVGIVKRRLMYWAVRYGGGNAWNKHRERERKAATV